MYRQMFYDRHRRLGRLFISNGGDGDDDEVV